MAVWGVSADRSYHRAIFFASVTAWDALIRRGLTIDTMVKLGPYGAHLKA